MSCTPKTCSYARLYAQSQQSLEQLVLAKDAASARAGKLRAGIFSALRQNYPMAYSEATRKIPGGIGSVPDDVVLAYLNGFLVTPPANVAARSGAEVAGLSALRAALVEAGVVVPVGENLNTWAQAVRTANLGGGTAPTPIVPVDKFHTETPAEEKSARVDSEQELGAWLFEEPPEDEPYDEPYGDVEDVEGVVYASPTPVVQDAGADLDDLFGPAQPDELVPSGVDGELFVEVPPVQSSQKEPLPVPTPTTVEPEKEVASKPSRRSGTTRIQPTLIPTAGGTPKNTRKKRNTGEHMSPPSAKPARELDDALNESLLAQLKVSRPKFTSDLVSDGVDAALVAAWVGQEAGAANPKIRVIGAKDQHSARGDLIVAHTTLFAELGTTYADSIWGRCVSGLRGPRLYEAGVVLSHYPKARTLTFDKSVTVITADDNTHAVGFVLTSAADLKSGSAGRKAVAQAVETLLGKRLHRIVVVTGSSVKKAPMDIAEAIRSEAAARSWDVNTPVTVARSADLGNKNVPSIAAVG